MNLSGNNLFLGLVRCHPLIRGLLVCVFSLSFSMGLQAEEKAALILMGDQDLRPYEYLEEGETKGANVAFLTLLSEVMQRPIQIRLMNWAEAQRRTKSGEANGLTFAAKNKRRAADYDFSLPTFSTTISLFTEADVASTLSAQSLSNKRIAVTSGGFPRILLENNHPDAVPIVVENGEEGFRRLSRGEIDGIVIDTWVGYHTLHALKIGNVKVARIIHRNDVHIALRKGQGALLEEVNQAILTIKSSNQFDEILREWSGERILLFSQKEINRYIALALLLAFLLASALILLYIRRVLKDNRRLTSEISERKVLQQAQQESEKRYRNLFENSPVSIWEIGYSEIKSYLETLKKDNEISFEQLLQRYPDTLGHCKQLVNYLDINKGTLDLFEAGSKTEFLENLRKIDTPDSEQVFKKEIKAIWEGRLLKEAESKLNTLKGNQKVVSIHWQASPGSETTLSKILVSLTDITVRKQTEEALQKSEEWLSTTLKSIGDAVIVTNVDGLVSMVNPVAEKLTGWSQEESIGCHLTEIYRVSNPEGSQNVELPLESVIREKTKVEHGGHLMLLPKSGEEIPVEDRYSPIIDHNGKVLGVILIFLDVSVRKKTQELLIQTEKMTSVGALAAGMAHELNNPLGGIMQGVQNIERRLSPTLKANLNPALEAKIDLEALQNYLAKREIDSSLKGIKGCAQKASHIINSMLQFSRKSDPTLVTINLAELIEKALELADKNFDIKNRQDFRSILILKEFEATLPPVPCIETEIEQVVLNILGNAAQALSEKASTDTKQITIRLLDAGEMVHIEIEDNGPGMPDSVRQRVFEPFFTTKTAGSGTGLGLAVSYMIMTNNHKGKIDVESQPGKGTKFTLGLPKARETSN